MSTDNIVPIGCVTSKNAKDAGFIPFSDSIGPVKSVEDCILKAEAYGNLCTEKGSNSSNDNKCSYVVYQDGQPIDLLREADAEYQKSKNCQTEAERNKYLLSSLQMFQDIWLNYSTEDRKNQLNPNSGYPFLDNYAPWIRKSDKYMTFFRENATSSRKIKPMKNLCWVGGKNILNTKYTELVNFEKNKNPKCKYGLYMVPGTEGENVADRLKKYYQQLADENKKNADASALKAKTSHAMAKFVSSPDASNMDVFSLFKAAKDTKSKLEIAAATKDTRDSINDNLAKIRDQERLVRIFNSLADTSKTAINRNIDFVKDKQQIAKKMNADLQSLNWSLEESENKEILQNKITTTLGIIIMLFAGLCVGLMVYYLIGGASGVKAELKNKSNKGVLNSIFGLDKSGKAASSSNKKALNSIFS